MWVSLAWKLSILIGLSTGRLGRRQGRDEAQEASWPQITDDGSKMSPSLNDIQLHSIKWPEVLVTNGEATLISENRRPAGRKSWCQTRQFQVKLSQAGCATRTVSARLCQGQCTSLWVPRPGSRPWSSCPVCRPVKGGWVSPSLLCEGGETAQLRLYRVKKCRCREPGTDIPPGLVELV